MGEYVRVAQTDEVPPGTKMKVDVEGLEVALFNLAGKYYATDDTCTHAGGSLSEGEMDAEEVQCPWHGARFNIRTGEVTRPPAMRGVKTYLVKVENGEILISKG